MVSYTVSDQAYLKIFFHAAKHPHRPVNGVLLGKLVDSNSVIIDDAIPLLHHWTSLSPMMDIGVDLARRHAEETGLQLVGFYQACERLNDTTLVPVSCLDKKIRDAFKNAIAFVVDGEKLGTGEAALVPYFHSSGSWQRHTSEPLPFTPTSPFKLADEESPNRAVALVRDARLHKKIGDFDDHLEDVSIDWLRNKDCMVNSS